MARRLNLTRTVRRSFGPALVLAASASCDLIPTALEQTPPALAGQDVSLTILHTSDLHSRLFPYDFDPTFTDNGLCLNDGQGPYGGIARIGYILERERSKAVRSLHLDSGDCFQGAIVFNEYFGEAEFRSMTEIGLDAAVVGNHEFDASAANLASQYSAHGGFALLAANYDFESSSEPWATDLEHYVLPSAMYDLDGLRVGVIGLGNLSSLNSIYDESNSMGITVIEAEDVIPRESSKLRAQGADIVIVLSHKGMDDDFELARTITGFDLIIGGHHHVAIDPPPVITNEVTGKRIPVVHSGAFAKFIGRLDVVVRDGNILSTDYTLFPVHSGVPQDPDVVELMDEYQEMLDYDFNLEQVIGYAEEKLTRYGSSGGDSMLGNLSADAMRFYQGVETEIALTNTLGIRADIAAGDITLDTIYNSMPFDNTITTMFLSGREVQELLDYVASRSSDRGCNSQAQISGMSFVMDCAQQVACDIVINGRALDENGTYELATNNYIANGGSGFEVLERNTTQYDTEVSIRDVVIASIQTYHTLPQDGVAEEEGRIVPVTEAYCQ